MISYSTNPTTLKSLFGIYSDETNDNTYDFDRVTTGPDECDEKDIDYKYSYDYERVIKDRLAQVNQQFAYDSDPPKLKSCLVSFDNAVTAIDYSVLNLYDRVHEDDTDSLAKQVIIKAF